MPLGWRIRGTPTLILLPEAQLLLDLLSGGAGPVSGSSVAAGVADFADALALRLLGPPDALQQSRPGSLIASRCLVHEIQYMSSPEKACCVFCPGSRRRLAPSNTEDTR